MYIIGDCLLYDILMVGLLSVLKIMIVIITTQE